MLARIDARDFQTALDQGAEGVGLYRTEYLFMNRAQLPDEEEQYTIYTELVRALHGAPVTIRTRMCARWAPATAAFDS